MNTNFEMRTIPVGLQFFGDFVDAGMRLDDLELFLDEVSTFLDSAAQSLSGATSPDGSDASYPYTEPLPEILYSSFVTSVVSFVERQAQGFAKVLQDAAGTPLSFSDVSGAWYEKFRKFVDRLAKLDLSMANEDWHALRGLIEVRNCLVHSGGETSDFRGKQLVEQFMSQRSLPLSHSHLIADRRLAEESLRIGRKFIEAIYRAAIVRYPS